MRRRARSGGCSIRMAPAIGSAYRGRIAASRTGRGEAGNETWEPGPWRDRTGANVWSIMSVDVERGLVFLPIGSAASDFYGGDRKGANLYANSIVALDAATGKRIWHRQLVHHDIWDYDVASPP